jgi:hypothetical protein
MKFEIISPDTNKKLQVAGNRQTDNELGPLNYEGALDACTALGSGWRIPSKDELSLIYDHVRENYPNNLNKNYYWTCSWDKVEDERMSELIRSGIYSSGPRGGASKWKNVRVILDFTDGSFGDENDCDNCFVFAVLDMDTDQLLK